MTKDKIKNTPELADLIAAMDVIEKHIQPTTKNNLGVDYTINDLDDFIEFGKKAFGVELTIKKSDNPDTYKNNLSSGLEKNSKKLEKDCESDCISRADARKAIIDHQYSDSFCEEHSIDHSINTGMALIALSDLPPKTPQESKSEWEQDHAILKAYSDRAKDILEKIRAEIEKQEKWLLQAGYTAYNADIAFGAIKSVLAESEVKI